jgi:hypothetical protein
MKADKRMEGSGYPIIRFLSAAFQVELWSDGRRAMEQEAYGYGTFLSPFTWRYGSQEMRRFWSEEHKRWLWRRGSWTPTTMA